MSAPGLPAPARVPYGRMLRAQTRAQFVGLRRNPGFLAPTVLLPTLFFAFFGLSSSSKHISGVRAGKYVMASFGTYGVIAVALYSFGVAIAVERGERTDVLMRATPLRPSVQLLARTINAAIFAAASVVLLVVFAAITGGALLPFSRAVVLVVALALGSLPFVAAGMAIGYFASPTAAAPITTLAFLPLAFASGLFVPLDQLPRLVRDVAPASPLYRLAELGWAAVGARGMDVPVAIAWLVAWAVVFALLATWGYRRIVRGRFT